MLAFTQHLQLFLLITSFIGLMQSRGNKINLQRLLRLFSKRMKRDIGDGGDSILVSSGILAINDNKRTFDEEWQSPDAIASSQQLWTTTIPWTNDKEALAHIIGLKAPPPNSISEYISYLPFASRSSQKTNELDYNYDHRYHPHSEDYIYNTKVFSSDFIEPAESLPKGVIISRDHLGPINDFPLKSKRYVKSYGK